MPKLSEKGVAQILLLVLLLVGLGVGLYLVQTRTNLLPKAAVNTKLTINSVTTACSTTKSGYQNITVDWTKIEDAQSYMVRLYKLGDNLRDSRGTEKCMVADQRSVSYNNKLEWEVPVTGKYEVLVEAYRENNGNCQWNVITTDSKQITNQTGCVITAAADCSSLAVQNQKFGLYTQKNCSTTPECVAGKPVYKCSADAPNDTRCVDYIRPVAEVYRCLTDRDYGSSE